MIKSAVARRYARGLEAAVRDAEGPEADPEAIAGQLEALSATVRGSDALTLLVRNPSIDSARKIAVMVEIAELLGAGAMVSRFVTVLADNERLEHLHDVAIAYRDLVDAQIGINNAEITTPQALDDAAVEDLRTQLAAATGRQVRLHTRIDPEVLGGLVTRIGDVLYDGSLRHQLARMRSRMMES
jgi:F-type H+-transporting ATPase subunit delta